MKLSVVMSVFNGAARLEWTLESILGQSERDFELLVVDDGSTDETAAILERHAALDSRLRVFTQDNTGLTRALIRGCNEARAGIIARHDSGDRSLPDRFARQLTVLESDPSIVLASCATRHVAPGGETMYVSTGEGEAVRQSLLTQGIGTIRGLSSHGSAMFRREAYLAAGGYRAEFRFGQDLDLWIRLAAVGRIAFVPEVLYEAVYELRAISSTHTPVQVRLGEIALQTRDHPEETGRLLEEAARVSAAAVATPKKAGGEGRALYFIATCLRTQKDPRWRVYARKALRHLPFSPRVWALIMRGG